MTQEITPIKELQPITSFVGVWETKIEPKMHIELKRLRKIEREHDQLKK